MTTAQIELYRPAEKGDRVVWKFLTTPAHSGRVTKITLESWRGKAHLMYHILDGDGITRVVPARYVQKENLAPVTVVTLNPLDVKPCRYCQAYLQSGLQDSVHPNHYKDCELYPDNAWKGYRLVKLEGVQQCPTSK